MTTYNFVGSVNDSGLFTPAGEGPNPARKKQSNNFGTNNWGDVWVDATLRCRRRHAQIEIVPCCYDSAVCPLRSARGFSVSTIAEVIPSMAYRPAEAHAFRAADAEFLYLVPSGAIFRMEGLGKEMVDLVRQRQMIAQRHWRVLLEQGLWPR